MVLDISDSKVKLNIENIDNLPGAKDLESVVENNFAKYPVWAYKVNQGNILDIKVQKEVCTIVKNREEGLSPVVYNNCTIILVKTS